MNQQHFPEFVARVAAIGELFGKELSQAVMQIYWETLKDLSLADFQTATNIVVKSSKFMPRPAELREAVLPDLKSVAALAYDRLIRAVSEVGTYKSVTFDDPVLNCVVDSLGGWIALGEKTPDEWLRKEAERLYQVYAKRIASGGVAGVPVRLVGRLEMTNSRGRLDLVDPPVVIGDQGAAKKWLALAAPPKAYPALRLLKSEHSLLKTACG